MEAAIIGVIGTLLGTILGWFLNVFSGRGKISAYLSSWDEKFEYLVFDVMNNSNSIEQTEYFEYSCSIDIYNSSVETKILRNIRIVFCNEKKEILSFIPNDKSTKRFSCGRTIYENIVSQNIPPNSVINLNLSSGIWIKEFNEQEIFDANKIYFEYVDEKSRKRRCFIKKVDYNNYFDNQEDKNGQAENAE